MQSCGTHFVEFLFGRTRAGVLRILFMQPHATLSAQELAQAASLSVGSVYHETRILSELGLLVAHPAGARLVRYQANHQHADFPVLRQLLARSAG